MLGYCQVRGTFAQFFVGFLFVLGLSTGLFLGLEGSSAAKYGKIVPVAAQDDLAEHSILLLIYYIANLSCFY